MSTSLLGGSRGFLGRNFGVVFSHGKKFELSCSLARTSLGSIKVGVDVQHVVAVVEGVAEFSRTWDAVWGSVTGMEFSGMKVSFWLSGSTEAFSAIRRLRRVGLPGW